MSNKLTMLFCTAALLATGASFGQTNREILVEDPKEAPNLRLELTPLNTYVSYVQPFAGWSVKGSYRWKNKFALSADFRKEFFDFQEIEMSKEGGKDFTYGQPHKGSGYEVIGTYFFATREKEVSEKVAIKSRSVSYRIIEVTVDPVPVTKLRLYGARLGFGSFRGTTPLLSARVTEVGNPSNAREGERIIPLQKTGTLYAGISSGTIRNLKVRYPKYGVRRRQAINEYFADLMYAPSNSFSPVAETEGGVVKSYRISNMDEFSKLGFRAGMFRSRTGKWVNLGYGVEAGAFPGAESFNRAFYFNFRLTFSLLKFVGPAVE